MRRKECAFVRLCLISDYKYRRHVSKTIITAVSHIYALSIANFIMKLYDRTTFSSNHLELNRQLHYYQNVSFPRIFITTFDNQVTNMRISCSASMKKATGSGSNTVNYVIVELDKTVYRCAPCDTMSNVTIPFQFKVECYRGQWVENYRMKITSMTDQRLIGNFIVDSSSTTIIKRPYDEDKQLLWYPTELIMEAQTQQKQSAETIYNQILENEKLGCCYTIKIEEGLPKNRYDPNKSKVEIPSIHPTDNIIRDQTNSCVAYGLPTSNKFTEVKFEPWEENDRTTEWRIAVIPKKNLVSL